MEIKRYSKNLYNKFYDRGEIYIHDYKTKKLLGIVIVDLEDLDFLRQYKWSLNHAGYAINHELGLMHRYLMKPNSDELLDHINENKLDNRKRNLRVANRTLNTLNTSYAKSNNKTGVRGVTERRGKYRATIKVNGKQTYLGDFSTIEEASEVYENKRRELLMQYEQN